MWIVGNTQTWYGRFDVIIGKTAAYEQNGLKKKRCESLVAATTVSEEYNDDSSDEDDYFQNEAKPDNLDGHSSELISQTTVFSFHQKKCNPSLSLVPSIGVMILQRTFISLVKECHCFMKTTNYNCLQLLLPGWL